MAERVGLGGRRTAIDVALVFACLYNISFLAAPSVTTARVALVALALLHGRRWWTAIREVAAASTPALLLFGAVVLHALLVQTFGTATDVVQLSRLLNFGVFVLITGIGLAVHVDGDPRRFARAVAIAALVQTVCIVVSYQSAPYRSWLAALVVQGGNIPLTSAAQAPGFSNSSGAALSLVQALGVFSALYAMRTSRRFGLLWAVVAVLNLLSTLLVGRTGLVMALGFVGAAVLLEARARTRLALAGVALAGVLVLATWQDAIVDLLAERNPLAADTVDRAMSALRTGWNDPSIVDVRTQPVPRLEGDTVIGTGRVVDEFGLNASGNDSGYVQTYYALGLPATVIFYATWTAFLAGYLLRVPHRGLYATLGLGMLIVEAKEPFIFKYALPLVLWTALLLEAHGRPADASA